jgi:hypothetical protein
MSLTNASTASWTPHRIFLPLALPIFEPDDGLIPKNTLYNKTIPLAIIADYLSIITQTSSYNDTIVTELLNYIISD